MVNEHCSVPDRVFGFPVCCACPRLSAHTRHDVTIGGDRLIVTPVVVALVTSGQVVMASPSFNPRSPSVKRIMQEVKEINQLMSETQDGTAQFAAEALESDIFEWQFAIRGPDGTDFEGGIYHGRILLPHDYPFRPPSFIMLTPVRACNPTALSLCQL